MRVGILSYALLYPALALAQYPRYPGDPPEPAATAPSRPLAAAQPPAAARPARLTLATRSRDVAQLVTECANQLEHQHLEIARKKCSEALAKEETLAFGHYLLARAEGPAAAARELKRAVELMPTASRGEQLFIEAYRAVAEARPTDAQRAYDQLVAILPGDARALVSRGQFRAAALGDSKAAADDFGKAIELDPKYPAAYGFRALALADSGQLDEAMAAAKKYVELAATEANAFVTEAKVSLRRAAADEAVIAAKKALSLDPRFSAAQETLGDALLFSGRSKEARRSYGQLAANEDPEVHHAGAMRHARSWLFDGRAGDCERELLAEAELATKAKRPGAGADALVDLGRAELDRGALAEAGQSLRKARAALEEPDAAGATSESERRRLSSEGLFLRTMILGAVGERQLAEARADEMGVSLKLAGDPRAGQKATALKGWLAARNGDDKAALGELSRTTRPTLRLALALAAVRAGDEARARAVIEELGRRMVNDIEGALTRPRAVAWLKQHAAPATAKSE